MTLLRPFMAWGIDLNPLKKGECPQSEPSGRSQSTLASSTFQALSLKLLLSYLGAMMAVMGISAGVVYQFFAYSLSQKLDLHLATIADAARHNFAAIQKDPAATTHKFPAAIDRDGDLDLPWQDLKNAAETVEWFDAGGKRLSMAGNEIPLYPLTKNIEPLEKDNLRSLTVIAGNRQVPHGYVRVSANTHEMHEDLDRLLVGLGIGGTVAVALTGATGWWLTRRSLLPIERSMEKLQQFTADASHELRSPITAIRTAVEVMQSHPERVHLADVRKLAVMGQATQHMTHLIEDLLLLARSDRDAAQLMDLTQPIPLHELLEDLVELLQSKATSAGVHLYSEPFSQSWVQGNTTQIRRVFLNLLDNAIAYTPTGGSIHLSLTQKDAIALISIRDTGIGIDPEQLPYIFDRFWRADRSRNRQSGGTGLGLAIARAIVETHHGRITVHSELGVGSCFQVELPRI
jgi:signal transduction histidine kinase